MVKVNKNTNFVDEKALQYTKGTFAIEDMYLSEEQEKLRKKNL